MFPPGSVLDSCSGAQAKALLPFPHVFLLAWLCVCTESLNSTFSALTALNNRRVFTLWRRKRLKGEWFTSPTFTCRVLVRKKLASSFRPFPHLYSGVSCFIFRDLLKAAFWLDCSEVTAVLTNRNLEGETLWANRSNGAWRVVSECGWGKKTNRPSRLHQRF